MIRKKYSKKEIGLGLFCAIFIITVFTFYIWHQMESVRLGYKTGQLEQEILSLKEKKEQLEAIKSSLLSLERVERIAREKLDLGEPEKGQIIFEENRQVP